MMKGKLIQMTKRMTAQEKRAIQYKENCEALHIFDEAMKDFCKDFSLTDFYDNLWKCEEKIFSSAIKFVLNHIENY